MACGAILLGNEVSPWWEWLPATTASRIDAAPTEKGSTSKDTRSWMLDKNVGEASGLDDRGWKPLPQNPNSPQGGNL
jgi:hypothetical protein